MDTRRWSDTKIGKNINNNERKNKYKSIFRNGKDVKTKFDRKDRSSASEAYFEFEAIKEKIPQDEIIIYTDQSARNETSGAGVAIYRNDQIIKTISTPTGKSSINYAEL